MEKILNINVDHVATLRQARLGKNPDPIEACKIIKKTKAHGIVMHLREDRRHIQDNDLYRYKSTINLPLNLEMAPTDEMVLIANKVKPKMVTLVPEKRLELTTEGGLDLKKNIKKIHKIVNNLNSKIQIMIFIDSNIEQIALANTLGIHGIEINTGKYTDSDENEKNIELKKIKESAKFAQSLNLYLAAGHGLDIKNITKIAAIKEIKEFNIGHSIIGEAIFSGLYESVNKIYAKINK
jgi:pyridoxine 5-phosphate synthase